MPENNRFQFSDFNEIFGELEEVHRVRRSLAGEIVVHALISLIFFSGLAIYAETREIWTIPVCVGLPFLVSVMLIRQSFSTRRDELRIYQNGFTYQGGKKLYSCLWEEITEVHYRERVDRLAAQFKAGAYPLERVEKNGGEQIFFTDGLGGTEEIENRFREFQKTPLKLFESSEDGR